MGSHAKTRHRAGSISPAPFPSGMAPLPAGPAEHLDNAQSAVQELLDHCTKPVDQDEIVSVAAWYASLTVKASHAAEAIAAAEAEDADPAATGQLAGTMQLAASGALGALPKDQLLKLAAWEGFGHPALACLAESGPNPLVHWLDPAYPPDAPSKLLITAKALERYAALCQGQTMSGLDLAALHVLEGTPAGPPPATWDATLAEVDDARTQLDAALDSVKQMQDDDELGAAVAGLIAAENHLFTAQCPGYAGLAQAKHEAASAVSSALDGASWDAFEEAITAGGKEGLIGDSQAVVLDSKGVQFLLRRSFHPDLRTAAIGVAATRDAQLATLHAAQAAFSVFKATADTPLALDGTGQVAGFATAAHGYLSTTSAVQDWAPQAPGLTAPYAIPWLHLPASISPDALTGEFRGWAKHQDLEGLRQAAGSLGLEHAAQAGKAQVIAYIAARWDPSAGQAVAQDQVPGKQAPPAPEPAKPPKATSSSPAAAASPAGFAAKHKQLVAALVHAKATTADLPARLEPAAVASFKFGKGQTAVLGGMHAKTIHTGPDGGKWLFKPDKQARGARAHAEAAASALLHAGGVPSIPVYAVTADGKPGAIQPLIKGATQLGSSPFSWTQTEVDAIVRYHVAAWLAGDHDGKPDNVLRTPSGGMVPIDQGQAFKHYGSDKLDIAFHPNATYGAERPVYHQVYEAHLNGGLGPGVTVNPLVAHPVIRQYEKMPDAQLRAILHDTAHHGAASGVVAWIPAMRSRAAKQHGIGETQVTKTQIAEAFLDHACERKHGLRKAFTEFFTTQVKLPAAAALRHAG
jgi:hypothetical protein